MNKCGNPVCGEEHGRPIRLDELKPVVETPVPYAFENYLMENQGRLIHLVRRLGEYYGAPFDGSIVSLLAELEFRFRPNQIATVLLCRDMHDLQYVHFGCTVTGIMGTNPQHFEMHHPQVVQWLQKGTKQMNALNWSWFIEQYPEFKDVTTLPTN